MSHTIEIIQQEEKLLCIDNSLVLAKLRVEIPGRESSAMGCDIHCLGGTSFVPLGIFEKSFHWRTLCTEEEK